MEHGAALLAHAPAGEALERGLARQGDQEDAAERLAAAREQRVERPRLRQRARKTVEEEAALAVGGVEALGDEVDHDLVGDQPALLHGAPGLEPERRAAAHRLAQQVAGRDVARAEAARQQHRLRPLACARHSHDEVPEHARPTGAPGCGRPS